MTHKQIDDTHIEVVFDKSDLVKFNLNRFIRNNDRRSSRPVMMPEAFERRAVNEIKDKYSDIGFKYAESVEITPDQDVRVILKVAKDKRVDLYNKNPNNLVFTQKDINDKDTNMENVTFVNSKLAKVIIDTDKFSGSAEEVEKIAKNIGQYGNVLSFNLVKNQKTASLLLSLDKDHYEFMLDSAVTKAAGADVTQPELNCDEFASVVADKLAAGVESGEIDIETASEIYAETLKELYVNSKFAFDEKPFTWSGSGDKLDSKPTEKTNMTSLSGKGNNDRTVQTDTIANIIQSDPDVKAYVDGLLTEGKRVPGQSVLARHLKEYFKNFPVDNVDMDQVNWVELAELILSADTPETSEIDVRSYINDNIMTLPENVKHDLMSKMISASESAGGKTNIVDDLSSAMDSMVAENADNAQYFKIMLENALSDPKISNSQDPQWAEAKSKFEALVSKFTQATGESVAYHGTSYAFKLVDTNAEIGLNNNDEFGLQNSANGESTDLGSITITKNSLNGYDVVGSGSPLAEYIAWLLSGDENQAGLASADEAKRMIEDYLIGEGEDTVVVESTEVQKQTEDFAPTVEDAGNEANLAMSFAKIEELINRYADLTGISPTDGITPQQNQSGSPTTVNKGGMMYTAAIDPTTQQPVMNQDGKVTYTSQDGADIQYWSADDIQNMQQNVSNPVDPNQAVTVSGIQ